MRILVFATETFRTMRRIFVIALLTILCLACSKEEQLSNRLVGTWSVDRLEISVSGSLPFTAPLSNVGTITFKNDGTGKNNIDYSYTFLSETYAVNDNEAFKWENSETTVTMEGNANSGEQTIIWEVADNAKKKQVWTRVDDLGLNYEMELSKQD